MMQSQQRARSQSADAYDRHDTQSCIYRHSPGSHNFSPPSLKALFRRSKQSSSESKYKSTASFKAPAISSKAISVGCLPSLSHLTVCGRWSPSNDPSDSFSDIQPTPKVEPILPRNETSGEIIARELFSKGELNESELLNILKGEEKFACEEGRPKLRDPVTLEPLGDHQFTFIHDNGTIAPYNLDTLIQYFLTSGDFREPVTRLLVTDDDLTRMDLQAREAGFSFASVLDAKHNPQTYCDQAQRDEMLTGLDRLVGEVVSTMIRTIEAGSADSGQIRLLLDLFPQFSDYFGQLSSAEPAYAQQCLTQYLLLVDGPPNSPIKDNTGLKKVVVRFLQKYRRSV